MTAWLRRGHRADLQSPVRGKRDDVGRRDELPNPNPQGDAMKLQRMQKPRTAREGMLGQAYGAAAEVISPIWEMFQWGNVPIFKILGGFFAVFLGFFLFMAHMGGWLAVWWNWIARTLGFGAFVLGALTAHLSAT